MGAASSSEVVKFDHLDEVVTSVLPYYYVVVHSKVPPQFLLGVRYLMILIVQPQTYSELPLR